MIVAEAFDDYFTNIRPALNHTTSNDNLQPTTSHTFFIRKTNTDEVMAITNKLKNKTSNGHDNISAKFLKQCLPHFIQELTDRITECIKKIK